VPRPESDGTIVSSSSSASSQRGEDRVARRVSVAEQRDVGLAEAERALQDAGHQLRVIDAAAELLGGAEIRILVDPDEHGETLSAHGVLPEDR
jgi:hypothetical protein